MRIGRLLVTLMVVLMIVLIFLGVFLWWQYQQLQPRYHSVSSETVSEPVAIQIDSLGVAHIQGQTEADVLEAMGYWVASQRLWQMELMRRMAMGRLSELFGDTTLAVDRLFRTLALEEVAIKIYENASPQSRQWMDAYARGVNLYLQTTEELPIEFQLLQLDPEPWQPIHSIYIQRIMGWMLNFSWRADWVAALMKARLSPKMFEMVVPRWPSDAPQIHFGDSNASLQQLHRLSLADDVARKLLGMDTGGWGSNNWVIAGHRTVEGVPLLANDPHLMLSLPSIWIQVVLHTPTFTVGGFALPGAPGIVLGRNRYLAWGFTNAMLDDSDYLVPDSVNTEKGVVWIKGVAENLETVEHLIVSKGKKHAITVYRYRGLPLFNANFEYPELKTPLFLQWSGFTPSDELQAFIGLAKAKTVYQAIESLKHYHIPAQNVVLADTEGNIAYQLIGGVPVRQVASGILPLPFSKGEWKGYHRFEELPRYINPPEGVIFTANHQIKAPFYISDVWEPEFRAKRIAQMLNRSEPFTLADMQTMQLDVLSLPAQMFLPRWLPIIASQRAQMSPAETAVFTLLSHWNFQADKQQMEPLVFHAWLGKIVERLFKPQLGDTLFQELIRLPSLYWRMTFGILQHGGSEWFGESKEAFLWQTYHEAIQTLEEALGEPHHWEWGRVHGLFLKHAMGDVPLLGRILNRGPYPASGDPFTVNVGHYRFGKDYMITVGASMRSVTALVPGAPLWVNLPGGNSGNPFSQFYSDQVANWLQGKYKKIHFLGNQNWLYEFKLLPIKTRANRE